MRYKKSQFEIVGLLVIVIFITLAVLFVVQFVILEEPSSIKHEHREAQFASNMLSAFLETTSKDCYGLNVRSLLQDCVSNPTPISQVKCEDQNRSCAYLDNFAELIFKKTLVQEQRSFIFNISWEEGANVESYVRVHNKPEVCNELTATRIESKELPLKVQDKNIKLILKICSQ